jgi:serine protease AprX
LATDNRPPSDVRKSALWGTGNRGGEHRSSALWGRGGRGAVTALVAAFVLLAPLAAFAGGGNSGKGNGGGNGGPSGAPGWQKKYGGAVDNNIAGSTFVQNSLWQQAKQHGNDTIHVIIQSVDGVGAAQNAFAGAGDRSDGDRVNKQLNLIGAVAVDIKAKRLDKLARNQNLIITPDAPVHSTGLVTGLSSTQLWPYVSGNAAVWNTLSNVPTIAVVDSGLDAGRIDFGNRAYPQVNFSSRSPGATGDQRGHGTFVAGIAAGSAPGFTGAAPAARILPIRVMDQNGVALTSDVINALQWLATNKSTYNVRVVNLSLHSGTATHFYFDPLDRAAEKLWFGGVVVVAAAGNYGTAGSPSGVPYSPGNDPFVITVGAADLNNSYFKYDDTAAPWSAYGYTEDGFAKPEIGAPGRYMVGPVPVSSTLGAERPDHIVQAGYMQLSGTSFAAPVVAGTVAQMLAKHPSWTPDQVKGVLMVTATNLPSAAPRSLGVGELNAYKAVNYTNTPPNPNRAINAFARADAASGGVTFDYASWADAAHASASWADASWADASWADASWADASWADASWNDASWADASWADASWADASWADASWADSTKEDAAEGETEGSVPVIDAQTAAALQANPDLSLGADTGGAASPSPTAPGTVTPTPTLPDTVTSAGSDTTNSVVVPTVTP